MEESRSQAKERMENKTTGIRAMSCAISATPPKPLLHAKRDKMGPNGQKVGTITTCPIEVDQIATRAWNGIYYGNVADLAKAAKDFIAKYGLIKDAIFSAPEVKLEPITGKGLMWTCTHTKMTTAGLDNWEPAELGMLSLSLFDWLAELLNLVKDGCPWPDGLEHAKAAYLAKNPDKADNPLCYKVLMILPASYRRWATHRLQDLKPWTEKWALSEMYAGVGNQGAEDAWYSLAMQTGHFDLIGTPYSGGTVDIAKCFDQINRELLRELATRAGMPRGVLDACLRYQDKMAIHNSVAKGIGIGFCRRTGIPQGCPFSMMYMSLMMRPWIIMQKANHNLPKILADDILLMTAGDTANVTRFAKGLNETHIYLIDMGAKIAPDKNFNFASLAETREWLKKTMWLSVDGAIAVVDNFRYLGAHVAIGGKNTAATLRERFHSMP